ncbi:Zn-dependent hydrolase [Oceanobacillus alkalisoli]|uniref:Zn-dependent hydrolase n=1 Tax=Oceanobacillus alkalisoli TaxID=2925113 RepID=UPI001F1193BC|nr:Zn-dependent hydrolase [Oceanobacillus alkalisoli]MCF3944135.1 Zn-dependent hydrolase [Oceanobacillus alkalisoli]
MLKVGRVNKKRVFSRIKKLSQIGKTDSGGVTRVALSKEDKKAQELVKKWMTEAGLVVRHDNFGNMIGRKEGAIPDLPAVMLGSHIDSVRNGGSFDGVIGVLAGIEVVHVMKEKGILHDHPIEVVAFCEEEGSRFNDILYGSRGMVGNLDDSSLSKKDHAGITRYDALKQFGFGIDPDKMNESIRYPEEIRVFLEMHIEQGPFLDSNDNPIGIVTAIAGPRSSTFRIKGIPGHAGTVPMYLRKDPMTGASEIISEIERVCKEDPDSKIVGTIGKISSFPGGSNIIPAEVEFTLDLRDENLSRRENSYQRIIDRAKDICEKRDLTFEVLSEIKIDPVPCSKDVVEKIHEVCNAMEIEAPYMISGAGHDAMTMAEITDIGMIFVRCKDGISHQPDESASEEDISLGTEVLLETVLRYV